MKASDLSISELYIRAPYTLIYSNINFVHLCRDNVPTVLLISWPISASMFDGDDAAGPVPSLFCDDPDAAKEAIAASVAKATTMCRRSPRSSSLGRPSGCKIARPF